MHSVRKVRRSQEQEEARLIKEKGEIEGYRKLDAYCQLHRSQNEHSETALHATAKILRINPEYYTMWNYRREILVAQSKELELKYLLEDLKSMVELMQRFPKVYWIWNHRAWVFMRLQELTGQAPWEKDLELDSMMLEKDPRNFHGWHYRRYLISNLEKYTGRTMAEEEKEYTTTKINQNFSNYSAFHNRSLLLRQLGDNSPEGFRKELDYVKTAINMDPEDQSAWLYYRWVLTSDFYENSRPESVFANELEEMEELLEDEPNSSQCAYAIWQLGILCGSPKLEMIEKMIELDPLRAKRYEHLRTQLH